ncbi:hypothetical protein [Krasilnikovia sp. MM14-A1259]|uniref:hypothetical protein n=1 Tax=Krasilnikovia sp. MM14-A1259 TaxID=3373539 RepID=UPI003805F20B
MRIVTVSARTALSLVLVAFGVVAALLAHTAPAAAASPSGPNSLVLSWVNDGDELHVEGYAYRAKSVVDIRLGDQPIQQARADETGRVEVSVPQSLIAAGQSGASIIVIGRSVSGASRVLISAVPPRAAVRGPVDLLPWSLAALAVAGVGFAALRRRGRVTAGAHRAARFA